MVRKIIQFSVNNKLIISLLIIMLILMGIYSLQKLPIDAVPDITNNQVQIVTVSPSLVAQEVEQFITYPVEVSMANIPNVTEIRSISRFGLSVVTIVFEDWVPILEARQFVKEQIGQAEMEIPAGLGTPELMPITTGLGEIYQYVINVKPGFEDRFDAMKLRTIQDWIVKRQLAGTKGIIDVSSFGGFVKQYEVAFDPMRLRAQDISVAEVFEALENNNQNSGGSYIEKDTDAFYIRTEGVVKTINDIKQIVVSNKNGIPVLIKDIADVRHGSPKRYGAMTMDGKGEAVGGITLMLKGGNSSEAIANVHERIELVKKTLPEGLEIYPYLDRSVLVSKTISTVENNLLEGGLIVIFVLILLLGNLRAGLIVASVVPLSMLFALILMNLFGISANLMSLGAIDFGIVVDGAVIIVEGVLHGLFTYHIGKQLTQSEINDFVVNESSKLSRSTLFGVLIILIVFVPIMTLTGIEGKMFRPMAMTFSFAILGALILSLTYVPMVTAVMLPKKVEAKMTIADRIVRILRSMYRPIIEFSLRFPALILGSTLMVFIATMFLFNSMGAVFIPTLEEGDLAMQMTIQPGSSLSESVRTSTRAEKILLENFPEVKHVVSKIGTAEVPTDPMAIEDADIMIILKEKKEWTSAITREGLVDKMKAKLAPISWASFEFTQPIQLRFNELMTGAKTDIAVKIFGENPETLKHLAVRTANLIENIEGAADVKVEQTEGLPQLIVRYDRQKIARYGLNINDLNSLIRGGYAGDVAGVVYENERKFDLVLRLDEKYRENVNLKILYTPLPEGGAIPLSEVASVEYVEGPMQISRESTRRFIGIGINIRNRDVSGIVADIEQTLNERLELPPGYSISYGGEFENLREAQARLSLAVPGALALILLLLYFAFRKIKYALIIFTAVPLSAIGGIIALWIRGMPFSISAGVGFIALFGVAVLNGIVIISYFNRLRYEEGRTDLRELIIDGGCTRLRPVVMTATVAALGFLPMALSTTNGAEVQKPLATVVIGGLISATLLTLFVLPVLYFLINKRKVKNSTSKTLMVTIALLFTSAVLPAQEQGLSFEEVLEHAMTVHPLINNSRLRIEQGRLGIDQSRIVPATDFNLDLGQMNSKKLDYNLSARQSFGNPAANKQRKSLAESKVLLSQKEFELLQHQLKIAITKAWQEWLYKREVAQLALREQELLSTLLDKTAIRLEGGEGSKLEYTLAENEKLQKDKLLETARLNERLAYEVLLKEAFLTSNTQLSAAPYEALAFPDSLSNFGIWLQPLEEQVKVVKAQGLLQKKMLQPEYSVGYFNQSIQPDFSLQGVSVGLQLPLWKKHNEAKVEEYRLEEIIASNRLDWQSQGMQHELSATRLEVISYKKQLDEYGASLKRQQELIIQLASIQQQEGEIDYFKYLQSLNAAMKNEIDYLELVHQYNRSVLKWNFLNQ